MTGSHAQYRTRNYLRQVKGSVFFKALAVAASFFAVPMMIQYLGREQYGVWSTLLSITSWVMFFDLGIGNGLRNKLAESLAKNQFTEAVGYISSGYTWIGVVSLGVFLLVAGSSFLIPWPLVFNTGILSNTTLRYAVLISAFFVLMNFWLGLINQILNALQKTSWVVFGQFLSNVFALLVVLVLMHTTQASLLFLVVGYGASIAAANIFLSLGFYRARDDLKPVPSFDRKHIYPLITVGGQFFIIQLAVLVIFTTDKILIAQLFGPEDVTQYDVVFKLFSVVTLIHGLLTAPLWSAYTDAYHRSDFKWMSSTLRKQLIIFAVVVLVTILLCFVAKPVIGLWVGHDLPVSSLLVGSLGLFLIISTWNNVFSFFLNGIGEVRIQVYTALIAMFVNIPVSIILVRFFDFGVHGVVLATCLGLSIFAVVGPMQVFSILAKLRERPVC